MATLHPIVDQEDVRPSPEQVPAVVTRGKDVVVTAGAGAGKTRTLVARYLSLLAEKTPLRSVVAITFTRKAAREMRNRVRRAIRHYLEKKLAPAEREFWDGLYGELDAARIGTIHQLCAEILRAHPAEAAVDPRFTVIDEAQAALMQGQAVDEALALAAGDEAGARLFALLGERTLENVLLDLLLRRLDAETAFGALPEDVLGHWQKALRQARQRALDALLGDGRWRECVESLRENEPLTADDRMAVQRRDALEAVREAQKAEKVGVAVNYLEVLDDVHLGVGSQKAWSGGKEQKEEVKEALRGLREMWREQREQLALTLNPLDEKLAEALPALEAAYGRAVDTYERLKEERQALDFDDLERRALDLLENDTVRRRWRSEVQAILVDEYQDTNARQRDLVNALNGGGRLFIVGDAKQSIYRFRGADVTVFRHERRRIVEEGGAAVPLSHSYRAHRELVADLNALLAPVLGEEDVNQPWREPFAPLTPVREAPELPLDPPHVTLHLTVGSKGEGALKRAAATLAARLREMVEEGLSYGDVAVLCRASTSFADYEDAFDDADIPYLTVAGRGFYNRPEIRDLLNALAALADPTDDLALAGLLRSPVFAFSDGELWDLRPDEREASWWEALQAAGGQKAARAVEVVRRLHSQAGRLPVADLLKAFLDETDYRAALHRAGQSRAARNVDKLLAGAHASGIVSAGEFLEYVENLRTGRAREGEAQATGEGAVRIMSVHAAKGLEFPVVVLGDVNYGGPRGRDRLLLHEEWGVLPPLKDDEEDEAAEKPAIYRLAKMEEMLQEAAEQERLLYVAATRAEEALILNGCIGLTQKGRPGWLSGWLKQLAPHIGLDEQVLDYDEEGERALTLELEVGSRPLDGVIYEPEAATPDAGSAERTAAVESSEWSSQLVEPLTPSGAHQEEVAERGQRVWRVIPPGERTHVPAWVVGTLVHEALALWRFPNGDRGFAQWVRARARHYGLSDRRLLQQAAQRTANLLHRLQSHVLYAEVEGAERRLHEVPYSLNRDGRLEQGAIDLLYRRRGQWTIVDFKTDHIEHERELERVLVEKRYRRQLVRYAAAVEQLVGERPRAFLCFLDVDREVVLKDEG